MKSILLTGGSGSLGRALVRRLLTEDKPDRIVVFSRGEHSQADMAREFAPLDQDGRLRFFIGDVRDRDRLEMAMRGVDDVIHAAALKIAPKGEYDPFEYVKTNVLGSQNVIDAAMRANVRRAMLISSDKAAAPHTLYGSTKLCAERLFVAANNLAGSDGTQFSAVRYGNVIGSKGSVIPFFQSLAASGAKALPITDPRMTRFEITMEAAVEFVLSSMRMMHGGEVFVPKLTSRRIVDVALEIAPNLPHEIVGIRPGEKLHEVLITDDEVRLTLELRDRYAIQPFNPGWTTDHLPGAKPVPVGFKYASDSAIVSAPLY